MGAVVDMASSKSLMLALGKYLLRQHRQFYHPQRYHVSGYLVDGNEVQKLVEQFLRHRKTR